MHRIRFAFPYSGPHCRVSIANILNSTLPSENLGTDNTYEKKIHPIIIQVHSCVGSHACISYPRKLQIRFAFIRDDVRSMASHYKDSDENVRTTAMVGTSGYYPGKGIGMLGFFESLKSEEDLPRSVPHDRWDVEAYYTPESRGDLSMYVRMASFVGELSNFDASMFRFNPPASCQFLTHFDSSLAINTPPSSAKHTSH